ncbi:MAG: hypothetical protein ACKKL4_01335 [Patescibacteria group bacterium]
MNRIVFLVFLLTVIPYLGLPQFYDIWIVLPLVIALLYTLYQFAREYDVPLHFSKNTVDDFFEKNKEEILSESGSIDDTSDSDRLK